MKGINKLRRIKIFTKIVLIALLIASCNDSNLPEKIIVNSYKSPQNPVSIEDKKSIKEIISVIDRGELRNSKMKVNIWLTLIYEEDTIRVGVLKDRYKLNRKQYICDVNFENLIEEIIGED